MKKDQTAGKQISLFRHLTSFKNNNLTISGLLNQQQATKRPAQSYQLVEFITSQPTWYRCNLTLNM